MLNQNDYIMRQIYQLTQVLERVIAAVVGLKGQNRPQEAIQVTNQALTEHLELDIDALLEMEESQMIRELKANPAMNDENLENIADLLFELAMIMVDTDVEPKAFLERALKIYQHIETEGNIYSIDRNHKIREIKKLLTES